MLDLNYWNGVAMPPELTCTAEVGWRQSDVTEVDDNWRLQLLPNGKLRTFHY